MPAARASWLALPVTKVSKVKVRLRLAWLGLAGRRDDRADRRDGGRRRSRELSTGTAPWPAVAPAARRARRGALRLAGDGVGDRVLDGPSRPLPASCASASMRAPKRSFTHCSTKRLGAVRRRRVGLVAQAERADPGDELLGRQLAREGVETGCPGGRVRCGIDMVSGRCERRESPARRSRAPEEHLAERWRERSFMAWIVARGARQLSTARRRPSGSCIGSPLGPSASRVTARTADRQAR